MVNKIANFKPGKSYAFVLPRFFEGIAGGAETLVGNLASRLAARGDKIEIFATCAKDNRTWENHFQPGTTIEMGVPLHRFLVDDRNLDSWIPKQISISQGLRLDTEEQLEWMKQGVNSTALYQELQSRSEEFDAIFFAPYLFPTTFWGSLIAPEKSFLIPCLHDESMAYQPVIASMFRQVKGALFNALPEQTLANSLYGKIEGGEVGMGFEPFENDYVNSLTSYFENQDPYILYVGRKETGKNVHLLIDNFIYAKDVGEVDPKLKLVIAGGGDFKDLYREAALTRGDIIDVGHVSEEAKQSLIKHALIFCQPSWNESFSIVIMEAWLLGVPCLVHADCAVTKYHVKESAGGLYFRNEKEFSEILRMMLEKPELRPQMAIAGAEYVKSKYSWNNVLARFDSILASMS